MAWRLRDERWVLDLEVPANVRARVRFPGERTLASLRESGGPAAEAEGVEGVGVDGGVWVRVGSGRYRFELQ